jgi:hypothetical protein
MTTHAFLSPDWIEAARAIHLASRSAATAEAGEAPPAVRMNLVVEEVPFGAGTLDAHVDTSDGIVDVELGHLDEADVKVALDYPTARAILVDGDAQAAMAAFMAGKVRVEGDMTKLLAFQSVPPGPRQVAVAEKIRAITS